jgi:two-component system response regulator HydG
VSSGAEALAALKGETFDAALVDLNMPGNFDFELLRDGRDRFPQTPLVVVTGAPTLPSAIESVKLGIADYLLKPVAVEDLVATIERVIGGARPRPAHLTRPALRVPEIVGRSLAIQRVIEIVHRVAETEINVLVQGENGTGKEIIARAIHALSKRNSGPFQVVDCAAIPESLFESTLFGHARGAFTGAVSDQPGLLRRGDGGTVFFDELGELPVSLQAKLLRALQFRRFTPVGQDAEVAIDSRFISATNRDLEAAIREGRFRNDLFYRLGVIQIRLPPLRERLEDLEPLAMQFLEDARSHGGRASEISREAFDRLRQYSWPGNIRELGNIVFRASTLCHDGRITPADLPPSILAGNEATPAAESGTRLAAVGSVEREYLVRLLKRHGGNVTRSARDAGMSRQGFYKLLEKHQLTSADFRD